MNFFAAVKVFLAKMSEADVLSEVAHDMIRSDFIPRIRKMEEQDDQDYSGLIELYEKYTKGSKGGIYGAQALKAMRGVAASSGFESKDTMEDLVHHFIADNVYKRKAWKHFPDRDILRGPEQFAKWFTGIARLDAKDSLRKYHRRRQHETHLSPGEDDDSDPLENKEGRPSDPVEGIAMSDIKRELRKHIKRWAKRPWQLAMFDIWMKEVEREGGKVNMTKKVYPVLEEQYGVPYKTLTHNAYELKRAIASFFMKEGYSVGGLFASSRPEGMSIQNYVAYREYRKLISRWVVSTCKV